MRPIIGLTGGSGAGKSLIGAALAAQGAGWVDADAVYRALCQPHTAMTAALQQAFGDVLTADGALDRPKLAEIVFHDRAALARLGAITTPAIRAAMEREADALLAQGCPAVLYDAPTLFQSGIDADCVCTIGVIADRGTRIARIMARDGLSEAAAAARIDAQPDNAFYRSRCTYLVENSGTAAEAEAQACAVWRKIASSLQEASKNGR